MIYVVLLVLVYMCYRNSSRISDAKEELTKLRRQVLADQMSARNSIEQLYQNMSDMRYTDRHR